MFGIDPQKLAQVKTLTKDITAEIRIDYKLSTVSLKLKSSNPASLPMVKSLTEQFGGSLATQLSSFFGINGKIIEAGKD